MEFVCVEQPSHRDLLDELHAHDIRLTRLEAQQTAMATEISGQGRRLELLAEKVAELAEVISAMSASQKILFWLAVTLLPMIGGLEVWAVLK